MIKLLATLSVAALTGILTKVLGGMPLPQVAAVFGVTIFIVAAGLVAISADDATERRSWIATHALRRFKP